MPLHLERRAGLALAWSMLALALWGGLAGGWEPPPARVAPNEFGWFWLERVTPLQGRHLCRFAGEVELDQALDREPTRPVPGSGGRGRLAVFSGGAELALGRKMNINRASTRDLQLLPRVGTGLASRILAERERRGGFSAVDDLLAVSGLGPALLEGLRPWVEAPR